MSPTAIPFSIGPDEVVVYPAPAKGNDLWFYYSVEGLTQVRIEIFNLVGERCTALADQQNGSGYRRTHWDLKGVAPGVYLYTLNLESARGARKFGMRKLVIVR